MQGHQILAQWIRISEILALVRYSYLTNVILPRLSKEGLFIGCIGTHVYGCQCSVSEVIM